MTPPLSIALLGAIFVITHLVQSHLPLRNWQIQRMGARGYQGFYSLVSLASFAPMAWIWWTNRHSGALLFHLRPVPGVTELAIGLNLLAFALIGGALVQPAPTAMTAKVGTKALQIRGMMAFTRHPIGWSVNLIAMGHMLVNGWTGDLAFFGTLLAVGVLGCLHQDQRHAVSNPAYADFMKITTFLPIPRPSTFGKIGARAGVGALVGLGAGLALRYFHASFFS